MLKLLQKKNVIWQRHACGILCQKLLSKKFTMSFKVDVPVFSEAVRKYDGVEIVIRGYIVPSQGYEGQTEFFLSAYPYNMCFFCGGAGPETIMEVYTKEEIDYTAEAVIVKGVLRLNDSDINRLIYALEDVELVE